MLRIRVSRISTSTGVVLQLQPGQDRGKNRRRRPRLGHRLIWGFNWASDADVKKYLPGFRLALDLGGFAFANLDFTAYLDDSEGAAAGGAPREGDSWMIDFNFARTFAIGDSNFSIEGHIEYIAGRDNEFGGPVEHWSLAQPQFRWSPNEHLSLGLEYQYWLNKLGDGATDENTVQALLVWKF